ncbi:hypothetical protein QQF64_026029, partial [Cirrhinus molitorella]
ALQWLLAGGQRVPLPALFDEFLPNLSLYHRQDSAGSQQNTSQGRDDLRHPEGKVSVSAWAQ